MGKSAAAILIVTAFCFAGCGNDEEALHEDVQPVTEASAADEPAAGIGDLTDNMQPAFVPESSHEVSADTEIPEEDEAPVQTEEEEVHDEYNSELADKHVRIRLDGSGADIFALWGTGRPDYRYGPSMMLCGNGGIDVWFASPGDGKKEYDWITYRHSDDGGETWGREKVVLSPTPGTADYKSVCDPDVFYYDGYYYMGYTATVNEDGLCNNVFIARSATPDGPFEKWNGSGWGGAPVPIIYFKGVDIGWGVGEPSFVIVDDTIYVYNTLDSFSDRYGWVRATEVRTADITDPMWPSGLKYEGISIYRNDATDRSGYTYADSDSWDVAYLEESHKFIALTTNRRFKDDSCLLYYESDDGINFERVSEINTDVISGCHNSGLMSDAYGHIKKDDLKLAGYAYSGSGDSKWGIWATRLAKLRIDYTDEPDREEDDAGNLKQHIKIDESLLGGGDIMLLTDQLSYTVTVGDRPVPIRYYLMNIYRQKYGLDADKVTVEKYDENILRVDEDGNLIPVGEGMSIVGIGYEGLRREICIKVLPENYDEMQIKRFYPVCSRLDVSMNEPIIIKVRPMAVFRNFDIHELSGYEINYHNIKFRSSNTSVCTVKKDGTVNPVGPGVSVITVSGEDCRYTVDVYVSE